MPAKKKVEPENLEELAALSDEDLAAQPGPTDNPSGLNIAANESIESLAEKVARLEAELAEARGGVSETEEVGVADDDDVVTIHFLADGFIALGECWYRGQEVRLKKGGVAWKSQYDRNGKSWLDYLDNIEGQYERWGNHVIGRGPWPGKKWGSEIPDLVAAAAQDDPRVLKQYQASVTAERKRAQKVLN